MKIALYKDRYDVDPLTVDISWDDLVQQVLSGTRPLNAVPKGFTCWSPVDIVGERCDANVRAVTAAVFDLDNVAEAEVRAILERVSGLDYVIHSTKSHAPPDNQCLRLVVRLASDVPVPAAAWIDARQTIMTLLGIPLHKSPSQIYNLPEPPVDFCKRGRGLSLVVEALPKNAAHIPWIGAATSDKPDPTSGATEFIGDRNLTVEDRESKHAAAMSSWSKKYAEAADIIGRCPIPGLEIPHPPVLLPARVTTIRHVFDLQAALADNKKTVACVGCKCEAQITVGRSLKQQGDEANFAAFWNVANGLEVTWVCVEKCLPAITAASVQLRSVFGDQLSYNHLRTIAKLSAPAGAEE